MSYKCPDCKRLLINRKRVTCEWCGLVLPDELVFSDEQVAEFEKMRAREEEAHGEFMRRDMLPERDYGSSDGGF